MYLSFLAWLLAIKAQSSPLSSGLLRSTFELDYNYYLYISYKDINYYSKFPLKQAMYGKFFSTKLLGLYIWIWLSQISNKRFGSTILIL